LVEYALLGMDVVSYQPVKSTNNLIELGYGIPCVTKLKELKQYISASKVKKNIHPVDFMATERVLNVIDVTMKNNSNIWSEK